MRRIDAEAISKINKAKIEPMQRLSGSKTEESKKLRGKSKKFIRRNKRLENWKSKTSKTSVENEVLPKNEQHQKNQSRFLPQTINIYSIYKKKYPLQR